MVFEGEILGGARKIWGNPYLNSTTILFDTIFKNIHNTMYDEHFFGL